MNLLLMKKHKKIQKQKLEEALTKNDYKIIRKIIRKELANVFFELFRKRGVWI